MRNNLFREIPCVVTGGAGFIGSHLADRLLALGSEVLVIDNLATGRIANIRQHEGNPRFRFVKGDIRDKAMARIIAEYEPDLVFHMAAHWQTLSVKEPLTDAEVNIMGMLNLLEGVRQSRSDPFIINGSSATVYGSPSKLPMSEDDLPLPLTPYGAAKLASEQYLVIYESLYGLRGLSLRYFNIYGPRQWTMGVISQWVWALLNGAQIEIYGNFTRDFTFVDDAVAATLLAGERRVSGVINVGSGKDVSLRDLITLVRTIVPSNSTVVKRPPRSVDVYTKRLADISKARKILGYAPSVSLEEGIRRVAEWWRQVQLKRPRDPNVSAS